MTTVINPLKLSCIDSNNLILSPIPNDVTLRILRSLESLVDFNSFTTCTHSTLKSRSTIWFDWAIRYGYEGKEEGSQKYLTDFFSRLAEVVENNLKVPITMKFRRGAPGQRILSGYLISQSINSLTIPLTHAWPYKSPELLFLIHQAAGERFSQILDSEHVIKEMLIPAARTGDLEKIRAYCMLIKNPNLAAREYTPMHAAAQTNQGDAIRVLNKYGGDVNCRWKHTEMDTHSWTRDGNIEIYNTPLELAYDCNSIDAVRALLESQAVSRDEFLKACTQAHLTMLKIFLEFASTYELNEGLEACFSSKKPDAIVCAELFLKYGADPNKTNNKEETFLYRSVLKGDLNFTRLFCTFRANPELTDIKGKTPLYIALKGNINEVTKLEIIRILCEHGADMYALDPRKKKTLFQHASKSKKIKKLFKSIENERAALDLM